MPVIGFIAHVDTSPEMPGAGVKPIVHRALRRQRYRAARRSVGGPAGGRRSRARRADRPRHRHRLGSTLLGADDKAGVAEIMAAAEYLLAHPEIPHGPIRIALHARRGGRARRAITSTWRASARSARTRSTAAARGELEDESFSADAITVTFKGFNTHPGYAKGRMVNAIKLAADSSRGCRAAGSRRRRPTATTATFTRTQMDASVDRTSVQGAGARLRDGRVEGEGGAGRAARARGRRPASRGARSSAGRGVYRNMREVLDRHPDVIERARDAIRARRPGAAREADPRRHRRITPVVHGAADAEPLRRRAQLPLAARVGRRVQDMEKAVEVIVDLCAPVGPAARLLQA